MRQAAAATALKLGDHASIESVHSDGHRDGHRDGNDGNSGEVVPVLSTSSAVVARVSGARDSFKELSPSKLLQGMAAMTSTVIGRHQDERQKADEMRSQTQKQEMDVMSRLMGVAQNAVAASSLSGALPNDKLQHAANSTAMGPLEEGRSCES